MDPESTNDTPATETPVPAAEGASEVDYNALLDSVPDEVLQKHSRFNGYAGRMAQRMAENERQRIQSEEFERARASKEQELLKLAEENPFEFSQRYLKDKGQEKIQAELSEVRRKAQSSLFERVAKSYADLPEWSQLTPDDFQRIQSRVAGKQDEELVATFNSAALDVVAAVRARAQSDKDLKDRLVIEKQAWEQEMVARRMRGEFAPDMGVPLSANAVSDVNAIRSMTDREFQEFYERNLKR